jgi:hypothetical protein
MSYRHLGATPQPSAAPIDDPHIAFVLAGPIIAAGQSRAECVERAIRRWGAPVYAWGDAPLTHGRVYVSPAAAALVAAVLTGARYIIPGDATPDQPLAPQHYSIKAKPSAADEAATRLAAHRRNLLTAIDDIWERCARSGVPTKAAAEMFAAAFGAAINAMLACSADAGPAGDLLELLELQIDASALPQPAGEGAR